MRSRKSLFGLAAVTLVSALATAASAQPMPTAPSGPPTNCRPQGMFATYSYKSVEVLPDGRVTFRICAPEATTARVTSSDLAGIIPGGGPGGGPSGLEMTKDAMGLWSVTTDKPVEPDTYRYNFNINGARVPDILATTFSEERTGVNSTFEVPGAAGEFQTWKKDVPHGAVSEIRYWSNSLGLTRRAHVYTPPGYDKGKGNFPVLYLVHGAGDSDHSWTSTGHAHYILDNLIAAGKAKPMIVVMPFGHTPPRANADMLNNNDFGTDLLKDLMPYVEANYRTINTPGSRAMAGLSMGGAHTIRNGLTHPELFHYIGIFSMGLGMQGREADVAAYQTANAAALQRGAKEFKLVYYAMGKDDFLYGTVAPTRGILDKNGIKHIYNESGGGHTWINWRRYLNDFAPRLFK